MNSMNLIKSIKNIYKKMSTFGKILLFMAIFLILVVFFKSIQIPNLNKEGYQQNDQFVFKSNNDIYDDFYCNIYDSLVFNHTKDDYEISEIFNKAKATVDSKILDVGSGTGHHVGKLSDKGLSVTGIDLSTFMIQKAKENYPNNTFIQGDVLDNHKFQYNSFTHILCLYFTVYYLEDKQKFFNNCMDWLLPGGILVVHLVDRDNFDPILPPGNPLYIVSPQKYAKERITHTKINFDKFKYISDFKLDKNKNIATFEEKFKFNDGKVRKQEHTLYMDSTDNIIDMATNAGFIIQGKIDLVKAAYEYQYLYILQKPS